MQEARLKSDGYTCRTVRRWLADGGSNPPSSTINPLQRVSLCIEISPVSTEGNGVFLVDLSQSHASRFPRFSTLSCAFFSTSCGRAKRQVRNIIPLQIKGLSSYWGRHFFRASVGRSPIREKERFSGSSNDGCTKRRLPPKHDVKATTGGERGDAD